MKTSLTTLKLLGLLLLLQSCGKSNDSDLPIEDNSTKILILGASRVQGNPPEHESFRFDLWKNLKLANYDVDFIGNIHHYHQYPLVLGQRFDPQHQGQSGFTSGQILADLDNNLARIGNPDIVIFSSPGGNDIQNEIPLRIVKSNIRAIVSHLQSKNPNVTVILEKMAPGHSSTMDEETTYYYEALLEEVELIQKQLSSHNSNVYTADMATGFTDDLLDKAAHYNKEGAEFIAARHFEVLEEILTRQE